SARARRRRRGRGRSPCPCPAGAWWRRPAPPRRRARRWRRGGERQAVRRSEGADEEATWRPTKRAAPRLQQVIFVCHVGTTKSLSMVPAASGRLFIYPPRPPVSVPPHGFKPKARARYKWGVLRP